MVGRTCAACDCKLDANPIEVKIGGKTVEVCCDECAQKLKEAYVSATAARRGGAMHGDKLLPSQGSVQTASGRISYTEQGAGPVALFVHGVLLNGYLWRHQLADLSDIRRCIAVD